MQEGTIRVLGSCWFRDDLEALKCEDQLAEEQSTPQ